MNSVTLTEKGDGQAENLDLRTKQQRSKRADNNLKKYKLTDRDTGRLAERQNDNKTNEQLGRQKLSPKELADRQECVQAEKKDRQIYGKTIRSSTWQIGQRPGRLKYGGMQIEIRIKRTETRLDRLKYGQTIRYSTRQISLRTGRLKYSQTDIRQDRMKYGQAEINIRIRQTETQPDRLKHSQTD